MGASSAPYGSTCTYSATVSGGVAPYQYRWSKDGYYNPADPSCFQSSKSFLVDGAFPASVRVTDAQGVVVVGRLVVTDAPSAPPCS